MNRIRSHLLALLPLIAVLTAVGLMSHGPARDSLSQGLHWLRAQGPRGALLYAPIYVLLTVLLIPGSWMSLTTGWLFGARLGLLVAYPSSLMGATLCFLLGRSRLRPAVVRFISRQPRFEALERLVRRGGFRLVVLLRLSPLFPYNVLNLALGVTPLRPATYILGTALGMIPGTTAYVYLGSALEDLTDAGRGGTPLWLVWTGAIATVLAAAYVGWLAAAELRRDLAALDAEAEAGLTDVGSLPPDPP